MVQIFYYISEIKYRSFYVLFSFTSTFLSVFLEIDPILFIITKPLTHIQLILTNIYEFWVSVLLFSFYAAIFITYPIFLYNIWTFFAPALFKKENYIVLNSFIYSFFIHIFCFFFVINTLLPKIITFFFLTQANSHSLHCFPSFFGYIKVFIFILFVFSIFIQGIWSLFILIKLQKIHPHFLRYSRKNCYLSIILISAFLAPPDILIQISLSCVFCFFFEFLLYLSIYFQNSKRRIT